MKEARRGNVKMGKKTMIWSRRRNSGGNGSSRRGKNMKMRRKNMILRK
jgi:hypothetical protein